jgi:penicillin amidase
LFKNTFHDELGDDLFEQILSTHFHKRLIAPLVRNPKSVWWDDTDTESVIESQAEIVQAAFQDALSSLEKDLGPESSQWRWGSVHTLEHGHPMGQVKALRSFFNVGPFPVRGSREVINNMYFGYGEGSSYKVGHGPSTRRVIDFSDIENSMSILPTGQSGNPFSKYYRDQAELFAEGKFRKMMLNKEEIISTSESLLTFKPVQE